jgi:hypothetical protein
MNALGRWAGAMVRVVGRPSCWSGAEASSMPVPRRSSRSGAVVTQLDTQPKPFDRRPAHTHRQATGHPCLLVVRAGRVTVSLAGQLGVRVASS